MELLGMYISTSDNEIIFYESCVDAIDIWQKLGRHVSRMGLYIW